MPGQVLHLVFMQDRPPPDIPLQGGQVVESDPIEEHRVCPPVLHHRRHDRVQAFGMFLDQGAQDQSVHLGLVGEQEDGGTGLLRPLGTSPYSDQLLAWLHIKILLSDGGEAGRRAKRLQSRSN